MNANVTKMNRGKLLALVAVFAMVICAFAITMPAEDVMGADSQYTHNTNLGDSINPGTPQIYDSSAAVTVIEDLSIPAGAVLQINGAKFTVNEGVTVTIEDGGRLIIENGSNVTVNGAIVASGNSVTGYKYTDEEAAPVGANFENDAAITLNGNITLERGAQMTGTGSVTMKGTATIDVTKRSSDISSLTQGAINMYEGTTLNIEGDVTATVNAASDVTYATLGSIAIQAGPAVENSRVSSNLTITVTSSTTAAYATYQTADDSRVTVRQYAVNVDGTIDAGDKVTFKMDVKYPDGYRFAAWNVHAYAKNVPASFAETLKLKVSGSDPQWQSIRFHQWRWLAPDNKNMQGWFGTVHWPEGDYCISATALFRRKDKPDVKTDKYISSELVFSIEK